jgi:nucleotide-binding universal stress UspA family protein
VITVFDRVVCVVEGGEAGAVAAAQAARLTAPNGTLSVVEVDDPWFFAADTAEARLARMAAATEDSSAAVIAPSALTGNPVDRLLEELERRDGTLAVVASHGQSRTVGITRGLTATHLLHEAPCSVLVARPSRDPVRWPASIVVGVDGSANATSAVEVARALAARFGAALTFVAALRDALDVECARRTAPEIEEVEARAVEELHERSQDADLVVVGSRGLHGVRTLGSISERVAHEAVCSVLVVRAGMPR